MFNKERFKAAVLLKGETMEDAAEVLGMAYSTLYRRIRLNDFKSREIETFCEHYGVTRDEIFFDGKELPKWSGC